MKRLSLLAILSLLCVTLACAQATRMLTGDKSNEYGLIYSLPLTELNIDLTANFTERVAGPYRQYAPRYLGKVDVIENDSRSCELQSAAIYTRGTAGPDKYLMTIKPGATTSICVDADGMLLAINTEASQSPIPALPADVTPQRPDMDEYLKYVDEDFLVSLSDAKKAQMLARAIMEIRESRLSLSRGTAETMPTDGRQLELMLQSLQAQEDAMMRAFTGYEYSYTESRRITVVPDSTDLPETSFVVARLAPGDHFRNSDDLVGEPIILSITGISTPELPLNAKGEPKAMPKEAVVYRLPGTANITLQFRGRNFLNSEVELAQNGILFGLDPKLFTDKRAPSCAIFNPATGAVEKIATLGTNP
ncbi:MAG: DUF4831 family protein [Bacteroidales bacterium]|nr:DUF4831 family protein [Bacteroidales bacterium]